jgi:PilZ domain-containing protein
MLDARRQPRTPEQFLVQIFAVHDPHVGELASVDDISSHGVRVATERSWEAGSHVELKSPTGNTWARARVVYCLPHSPKGFAVGLDFLTQTSEWDTRSELLAAKQRK